MDGYRIEAVLFDMGGVLQQFADGMDHKAIESRLGVEEGTLFRCLYRDSRYMELQVGKCSFAEWIASVREAMAARAGDKAEALLTAVGEAKRDLNPDMIGLVKRLRGRYRTGIISNTIPGLEARLRQQFDIADLFDVRIGSGDLGIAKPEPGIYLHAAQSLGVAPEACVFTDDVPRFAEAAREVGMHAFPFTGYEQLVQDLRSVGVQA